MGKNDGFDNMGVESILEDDSSLHQKLPLLHRNLDDSLMREEELVVAESSVMQTPYNMNTGVKNN
jgi:hypothetical protein